MQCPRCESFITENRTACSRCGAQYLPRRARFDPAVKEFSLTIEENDPDLYDDRVGVSAWNFPPRSESARMQPAQAMTATAVIPVWGGFVRRACALIIDGVIVVLLGLLMVLLSYVGYKVGLSAHGRSMTTSNASALMYILGWGWIVLSAAYFVLFHGMTGKTPGKHLLGVRVVGADGGAVTYGQALIRWAALVLFAPVLLGFLWVLWSREKRAWHDRVSQTWVIRG